MSEWNLSDKKIEYIEEGNGDFHLEDVREFIKRLKEHLHELDLQCLTDHVEEHGKGCEFVINETKLYHLIDKLAGDKLIGTGTSFDGNQEGGES